MLTAEEIDELLADYLARLGTEEEVAFAELLELHPDDAPALRAAREQLKQILPGFSLLAEDRNPTLERRLDEVRAELTEQRGRFSRFEVRDEIGQGGMGTVHAVWDPELKRELVLKRAKARDGRELPDAGRVARLLDEARVTGQLVHPGIVPVHEIGVDDEGQIYFTMQRVRGLDVDEVFRLCRVGDPEWPLRRVVRLLQRACEAVAYAHDRGVLHRDLKPSNVRVGGFGEVYVLDWGLARALEGASVETERFASEADGGSSSTELTQEGHTVGTPAYMSPEQARGEDLDARTDVYALGAMLSQLLTGRVPSPAKEGPPLPFDPADGAPRELAAICTKATARERDDRYASVNDLSKDLEAYLDVRVVRAYRTGPVAHAVKWMQRHPGTTGAAAAVVVLLGVLGGTLYFLNELDQANDRLATTNVELDQANRDLETTNDELDQANRDLGVRNTELEAARTELEERNEALADSEKSLLESNEGLERASYGIRLQAALRNLEVGQGQSAREELEAAPEAHRGFEWNHVMRRSLPAGWTGDAHRQALGVVFSPDGRSLFSVGDGNVYAWNTSSGEERKLRSSTAVTSCIAISPGGEVLVVGLGNGSILFVDADDGERLETVAGGRRGLQSVAMSPTGTRVASGDMIGVIRIFDFPSGELLQEFQAHPGAMRQVSFSPDGAHLVSAGRGRDLGVWDSETGELVATWQATSAGDVVRVAYSPDGERLYAVGSDTTLRAFDAVTGETLFTTSLGKIPVGLACRPDGELVAVGLDGGTTFVVDARTGNQVVQLTGQEGSIQGVCFSPDGQLLATASRNGTVRVQNVEVEPGVLRLEGHKFPSGCVAFSPDGTQLVSGGDDNTAIVWTADHGLPLLRLEGHTNRLESVAFSPDGELVVTASVDGTVREWDAATGEERTVHTLGQHVTGIAFRAGGEELLVTCVGGKLHALVRGMPDERRELFENRRARGLFTLACSEETGRIAVGDKIGWVTVLDADGEELWRRRAHKERVDGLAFSPDGRRLATAGRDWKVCTFRAEDGEPEATFLGHTRYVTELAYHPDGVRIATCGADGSLRLWNVESREAILVLHPEGNLHFGLAFDPAGGRLALGSSDFRVRVFETNADDALGLQRLSLLQREHRLRAVIERQFTEHFTVQAVVDSLPSLDLDDEDRARCERIARFLGERPTRLVDGAWELVKDPDVTDADAERALAMTDAVLSYAPGTTWAQVVAAVASYRAGDIQRTYDLLEPHEWPADSVVIGALISPAYLALAAHDLGRDEDVRAALATFEAVSTNRYLARNPLAWELALLLDAAGLGAEAPR